MIAVAAHFARLRCLLVTVDVKVTLRARPFECASILIFKWFSNDAPAEFHDDVLSLDESFDADESVRCMALFTSCLT